MPTRSARLLPAAVLAASFPLLLFGLLWLYAVDVPIIDQWTLIPELDAYLTGRWRLVEWFRSLNSHRLFIPRLILYPLAGVTGWNTRVEMALGVLAATAIAALLATTARRQLGPQGCVRQRWILPVASLMVFSLAQWENWLWGLQMHVFLAVALALSALSLLSFKTTWPRLCAAIGCALAATLTQGTGLVTWPAGVVALALRRDQSAGQRRRYLLAWAIASTMAITGYVQQLPGDNTRAPSLREPLRQPISHAYFAATQLGAPAVSFAGSAWPPRESGWGSVAATAGLVLLAIAATAVARQRGVHTLAEPLSIATWSMGVAAQVAIGRTKLGTAEAMASRYVTLAIPFWVVTIILLAAAVELTASRRRRIALGASATVMTGLFAIGSFAAAPQFPERHRQLAPARRELVRGELDALLTRLHPSAETARRRLPALRRHRLGVFREDPLPLPPPLPQPLTVFSQAFHSTAVRPLRLAAATRAAIPVVVVNTGPETWSAVGDAVGGAYSVRLASHWIDGSGRMVIYEGQRTELTDDLAAGAAAQVAARVATPEQPGTYVLRLTMVQEAVAWFDERGAAPLDLSVVVGPARHPVTEHLNRFLLAQRVLFSR